MALTLEGKGGDFRIMNGTRLVKTIKTSNRDNAERAGLQPKDDAVVDRAIHRDFEIVRNGAVRRAPPLRRDEV